MIWSRASGHQIPCLLQDLDEEYEAALERRRLEVEAERRMQEEEDARLLRALTPQQELPGESLAARWPCGTTATTSFAVSRPLFFSSCCTPCQLLVESKL